MSLSPFFFLSPFLPFFFFFLIFNASCRNIGLHGYCLQWPTVVQIFFLKIPLTLLKKKKNKQTYIKLSCQDPDLTHLFLQHLVITNTTTDTGLLVFLCTFFLLMSAVFANTPCDHTRYAWVSCDCSVLIVLTLHIIWHQAYKLSSARDNPFLSFSS